TALPGPPPTARVRPGGVQPQRLPVRGLNPRRAGGLRCPITLPACLPGLRPVDSTFMSDVTRILGAIEQGDAHAAEQLLPLVYDELRRLSAEKMAQERPGQPLQATALVHEAYVRLVDVNKAQHWNGRGHFFPAAAGAMPRTLGENASRKHGRKHGGACRRVNLEEAAPCARQPEDDLLSLNEALDKLAGEDPRKAELVKLRYFTGLSVQEAADVLGISRATADRYWAYAKVWLYCALS